jgi:DNA-binding LytR/AlgR family response regulator
LALLIPSALLASGTKPEGTVTIPSAAAYYLLVPTTEIHALEATGNDVCLHCERGNHLLRSTLSALETKLDPQRFLRTHRSWMINLDQVREAQPWAKGSCCPTAA